MRALGGVISCCLGEGAPFQGVMSCLSSSPVSSEPELTQAQGGEQGSARGKPEKHLSSPWLQRWRRIRRATASQLAAILTPKGHVGTVGCHTAGGATCIQWLLLDTVWCTGQLLPQRIIQSQMSVVLMLRSPELDSDGESGPDGGPLPPVTLEEEGPPLAPDGGDLNPFLMASPSPMSCSNFSCWVPRPEWLRDLLRGT